MICRWDSTNWKQVRLHCVTLSSHIHLSHCTWQYQKLTWHPERSWLDQEWFVWFIKSHLVCHEVFQNGESWEIRRFSQINKTILTCRKLTWQPRGGSNWFPYSSLVITYSLAACSGHLKDISPKLTHFIFSEFIWKQTWLMPKQEFFREIVSSHFLNLIKNFHLAKPDMGASEDFGEFDSISAVVDEKIKTLLTNW